MKKMMMVLVMVLGCVMSVFAQDHEFNKTLRKAENGDAESQWRVGDYYKDGSYGCTKSGDNALYWWVACIKNGGYYNGQTEMATHSIVEIWQKERNIIRDTYTFFNLLKDVSTYNCNLKAILGDCYYEGYGTMKDFTKAIDCYEEVWKSCEHNHFNSNQSAIKIGESYQEGKGGRQINYGKAIDYFRKAMAIESIMNIYDKVYAQDRSLDVIFFKSFSTMLSTKDYLRRIVSASGYWNENGIFGIKDELIWAESEFSFAVERKNILFWIVPSMYCLGYTYEMGRGVTRDTKIARLCYACAIVFSTSKKMDDKYAQLAKQRLDALRGGGPPSNNVATINFTSSTSSNTTNYNLRACIKSSSQVSNVKITANGREVYNSRGVSVVTNDGCDYSIDQNVSLQNGSNTITVSVTNASGTTSKSFDVYVENSISEKRVALVIGNANYRNAPLKTPINDANDIAERLRTFGFDVTLKTNLTLNEFKNVLNNFKYKANNSDVALFYYAGHGMEVNQTNFLFPVDIESFCDGNGVDASLNVLNAVSGADQKIVIIDACRNNPCRSIPGFKRMSAQNSFIAYSTSEGKLASDVGKNGRNSPYAEALLNALKWNSNMTLSQLFQRVNNSISTGQAPIYINSLVSDFIFNK